MKLTRKVGRVAVFVLAFVWATLNAFLSLFSLAIDTGLANTILNTSLTGTSFITTFAGSCTICALLGRIDSLF